MWIRIQFCFPAQPCDHGTVRTQMTGSLCDLSTWFLPVPLIMASLDFIRPLRKWTEQLPWALGKVLRAGVLGAWREPRDAVLSAGRWKQVIPSPCMSFSPSQKPGGKGKKNTLLCGAFNFIYLRISDSFWFEIESWKFQGDFGMLMFIQGALVLLKLE